VNRELLRAIRDQYLLDWNGLHGVGHWARVWENGRRLAAPAGAEPAVIVYFALFHDACRRNDGWDPDHGARGAELASSLRGRYFDMEDGPFALLTRACARHTGGRHDPSPTVLVCWDADRLDLARASIFPDPRRLCTKAARDPRVISWASERSMARSVPGFAATDWASELEGGR